MPEHANNQPGGTQNPQHEQLTYEGVLQAHPDMHPDLRSHVKRLAGAATEATTHIENPDSASSNETESSPPYGLNDLTRLLRNGNAQHESGGELHSSEGALISFPAEQFQALAERDQFTNQELAEFIEASIHSEQHNTKSLSEATKRYVDPDYSLICRALVEVAPDRLRALYHSDEWSPHLKEILKDAQDVRGMIHSLRILKGIHRQQDVIRLADKNGLLQRDEVLQDLFQDKDVVGEAMLKIWYEDFGEHVEVTPEESTMWRDRSDRFLKDILDLPEKLRDEILFASNSRTAMQHGPQRGLTNPGLVLEMLYGTAAIKNDLGVETMLKLLEHAGIKNFDAYKPKQLELVSKLIDGDPATIEQLKKRDVIVVMTDALGDDNGALHLMPAHFRSQKHRTLFFEINQASDPFRHLALLKKRDIKFSTLAFAGHGQENGNGLWVGDDASGFRITNQYRMHPKQSWIQRRRNPPQSTRNVHLQRSLGGIARAVDEYMQDSRGIDDNKEAVGRRRILLLSCSQAKPFSMFRRRQPGERREKLMHHLTRRGENDVMVDRRSTAEGLLRAINRSGVDIYGALEASALDSLAAENGQVSGLYFSVSAARATKEKPAGTPLEGVRFSMDENGILSQHVVEEIILNKVDDDEELAS